MVTQIDEYRRRLYNTRHTHSPHTSEHQTKHAGGGGGGANKFFCPRKVVDKLARDLIMAILWTGMFDDAAQMTRRTSQAIGL